MHAILNRFFELALGEVHRYEGTINQFLGDGFMALFGAPVAHEDDAERAVRAGLEMQDAAMRYATGIKQQHGVDFDLRVGINTGTAVLAFVGDAIKTEYTALGDAANVAARLQSAAEPGTVLISADTHKLVHALFDFRPRGKIEMKGKSEPVESYEVTGIKAVPEATRGLAGLSSPLVGRERQTALKGRGRIGQPAEAMFDRAEIIPGGGNVRVAGDARLVSLDCLFQLALPLQGVAQAQPVNGAGRLQGDRLPRESFRLRGPLLQVHGHAQVGEIEGLLAIEGDCPPLSIAALSNDQSRSREVPSGAGKVTIAPCPTSEPTSLPSGRA